MRKSNETLGQIGLIPQPARSVAVPPPGSADRQKPAPVFTGIDADVFTKMAWDQLAASLPVERRMKAVETGRALLAESLTLPLHSMGVDDLAMAVMQLRCSLAQLLTVIDHHGGSRPVGPMNQLDADDLVADLLDVIAGTAGLHADVAIDVAQPLPPYLIDTLARAIGAAGLRLDGPLVQALGACGTSSIRVTATRAEAA
ncbi:hypothetical protein [Kitasatospora sp. NPDC056184]|uniref:hypothetical protein n=1 Tax=Kitasatospora sp. NPDC056184 TaxID=3345738 RepID=UPI0035DCE3D4